MIIDNLPPLPITHNMISHIVLIGVIQSFFIGLVFLIKSRKGGQLLILWSLVVLSAGLVSLDLYLCYTGLMQYSLHLNDSTEFITLLIAPFIYLACQRMFMRQDLTWRQIWPHLIAPVLYMMNMYFFWRQPIEAKYNSYIDAYFPQLKQLEDTLIGPQDPLGIKGKIDWWILISFLFYFGMTIRLILNRRKENPSKTDAIRYDKHELVTNTVVSTGLFLLIFIVIESYNDGDAGDYIIGIVNTITSFFLSYFIISNSKMLDNQWLADKYQTSGIKRDEVDALGARLINYLQSDAFAAAPGNNQSAIAMHLGTSKSYLSRAVSTTDFDNYNDLINHYRIKLAKEALLNPANKDYTIEAIGNQVGFGSKSSFYSAFKKEVGMTPASFTSTNR